MESLLTSSVLIPPALRLSANSPTVGSSSVSYTVTAPPGAAAPGRASAGRAAPRRRRRGPGQCDLAVPGRGVRDDVLFAPLDLERDQRARPVDGLRDRRRLLELELAQALDERGVPGPYEAVLPTARYYAYLQAVDERGYPTARQLKDVFAAVHRSPVISGAGAVFSTRGGDFVLTVGGDLAVGYRLHDRDQVHLFCAETIAAQTVAPEAVCVLEAIVA